MRSQQDWKAQEARDERLMRAARDGDDAALASLGRDQETMRRVGSRALSSAVEAGHLDCAKLLVGMGVDPLEGRSAPLRVAARVGSKAGVEFLLPLSDPMAGQPPALWLAARAGSLECVDLIWARMRGLGARAIAARALEAAARSGHVECAQRLLSVGAAGLGKALSGAAEMDQKQCVELLMDRVGAQERLEALLLAAKSGSAACVELLLSRADPKAQGSLALRLAAGKGHAGVVEMLLPQSDPLASDSAALMAAAAGGHEACARLLLPQSDPSSVRCEALLKASSRGAQDPPEAALSRQACVGMLLEAIDPNALPRLGKKAREAARAKGLDLLAAMIDSRLQALELGRACGASRAKAARSL